MITQDDLLKRARKAIDDREMFVYDVASEQGQQVANVVDTKWLLYRVANRLIQDVKKYAHLQPIFQD